MSARFYAPDALEAGIVIALPDEEAQHLTRVLRLRPGADIRVFNGRGGEFDAVVERVRKDRADVRLRARRAAAAEPRVAVTVVQAVLKADKMDDVVRDAVMIGAAAVQPIVTTRTEVSPTAIRRGRRHERWQRIAVSSAKQCGRAVVPRILVPKTLDETAAALSDMRLPGPGLMFVEPLASSDVLTLADLDPTPPREVSVLIGPEGGWTRDEIEEASQSCRLLTLGARTIRADSMALVALTALFVLWREI